MACFCRAAILALLALAAEGSCADGTCAESEEVAMLQQTRRASAVSSASRRRKEDDDDDDDDDEKVPIVNPTCYIMECGCPGSYRQPWCSNVKDDGTGNLRSYVGNPDCHAMGEGMCNTCHGVWCPGSSTASAPESENVTEPVTEPAVPLDDVASSGRRRRKDDDDDDDDDEKVPIVNPTCYIMECGCPGSYRQPWCSNVKDDGTGNLRSYVGNPDCHAMGEGMCNTCHGVWCPDSSTV